MVKKATKTQKNNGGDFLKNMRDSVVTKSASILINHIVSLSHINMCFAWSSDVTIGVGTCVHF